MFGFCNGYFHTGQAHADSHCERIPGKKLCLAKALMIPLLSLSLSLLSFFSLSLPLFPSLFFISLTHSLSRSLSLSLFPSLFFSLTHILSLSLSLSLRRVA